MIFFDNKLIFRLFVQIVFYMDGNRMLQQITAIFSAFMVFFYLGVGIYLVFYADLLNLDKALRVIMGSTFLFYGAYRAFKAYMKIIEVFFTNDDAED